MNRLMRSFFGITLLSLSAAVYAGDNGDCCNGVNVTGVASPVRGIVIPRAQGINSARELIGWQDFIHLCDICETYGALAVEFEYTRSFRPARIARQLFGVGTTSTGALSTCDDSDDNFFLRFQGSNVANRSATSLLADNFGLSQDFDGTLKLRPRIDNFIVDFQFYIGLDCWLPGLYFEAHLPITHSRWDLFDIDGRNDDCPTTTTGTAVSGIEITNPGSLNTPFPACYMGGTDVNPATSIIQALRGNFTFGDMGTEWKFGRFSTKRLDITRLADIDLILGYDFLCNDCYHFGAFFQAIAPTGNSPDALFIFEPLAGDGGHWKAGGGITAHSVLWENDADQNLSVWLDGYAVHAFNNRQVRSFDLKNQGPLSRYMLLKEFDSDGAYTGKLINAINFTTRTVETKFRVEGDVSFKFAYRNCGLMADIGYNFWGRDCEEVKLCQNQTGQQVGDTRDGVFGIKGCEGVCALNFTTVASDGNIARGAPADQATTALNSTQSNANAFRCGTAVDNGVFISGTPIGTTGTRQLTAGDVASLTFAGTPAAATDLVTNDPNVIPTNVAACPTCPTQNVTNVVQFAQQSATVTNGNVALTPERLTLSDLNIIGVPSAVSHKVFGYVGYTWYECDFTPFIGIHAEVEFDGRRNGGDDCPPPAAAGTNGNGNGTTTTTFNRRDRAINQWGIGLKGGISF